MKNRRGSFALLLRRVLWGQGARVEHLMTGLDWVFGIVQEVTPDLAPSDWTNDSSLIKQCRTPSRAITRQVVVPGFDDTGIVTFLTIGHSASCDEQNLTLHFLQKNSNFKLTLTI